MRPDRSTRSSRSRSSTTCCGPTRGARLIWALSRGDWAARFDHVLVMDKGRVVEHGRYAELDRDGSALQQLVAAA